MKFRFLTTIVVAYIKKYYTTDGEKVRDGVYQSTLADAAAIAAQKTCPVMDEPLGCMGVPGKVNVSGKAVYWSGSVTSMFVSKR